MQGRLGREPSPLLHRRSTADPRRSSQPPSRTGRGDGRHRRHRRFLGVFTQYIDSGFGLVQGDVRWLAGVLIAIDITLAGLFWAMAPDEDVLARLIKKTLYIGVFAFIIGNYNNLAQIIYNSFAGLGIKAGGGTMSHGAASSARQARPGRHRRRHSRS